MSESFHDCAAELDAALRTQANRTVAKLTKIRARTFAKAPLGLDELFAGLTDASPHEMIAIAEKLLALELKAPRRWCGFGGETPALNARAMRLLGRVWRRKGCH